MNRKEATDLWTASRETLNKAYTVRDEGDDGDDHAAALEVIERHIAYFSGQSPIPDDINWSEP